MIKFRDGVEGHIMNGIIMQIKAFGFMLNSGII